MQPTRTEVDLEAIVVLENSRAQASLRLVTVPPDMSPGNPGGPFT
jgi:hypothetical protein